MIYAHRRAQVDQLNSVCQRLRADHGQLGIERLAVGDRLFAVGDVVVLGANARDRLGVVNGTIVVIVGLDPQRRPMTVRTLEDDPPRVVRLPGWYLDTPVRPGQSRRVDLAYAQTDMRSQGRTERRALLAPDGAEDMQGGYVQLTRGKERTDLYLTVGPEPLGPDEERPHPAREARGPEELLARVLTRDGSKTLASDTVNVPDVRRLSTRQLRAERDRLAALRAQCPPDCSWELRLASQRAADAEQARQQALKEHQAAADQVGALPGRLLRRQDLQGARDRLALAEHALATTTGQADQAAERLGVLRRAQQRRLGWMEANDEELRVQERAVVREDAWRRRVDQRALVLDPPAWLVAELGPVPSDPRERAVWRTAAAELDGYRRAYGLHHHSPAKHGWVRVARDGRAAAPASAPTGGRADETAGSAGRRRLTLGEALPPGGRGQPGRRPRAAHRDPAAAEGRYRVDAGRLLDAEPRRDHPGRRRDWQQVRAALERLADHHRRDDRHRSRERAGRLQACDLGRQERNGR